MQYSDLIIQEEEFTYSVNIQFDIENDRKLSQFIPNETTCGLLREYFVDITRDKPTIHSRILYGSYGTGKSHFLTVLSLLLSKKYVNGVAYNSFINRIKKQDLDLAADIDSFVDDCTKKPFFIIPIVFDFGDFERCLYFSMQKALDSVGIKVNFKTFYAQALSLLEQWDSQEDSRLRLEEACLIEKITISSLKNNLRQYSEKAKKEFEKIFSLVTYGVNFVYEVANLAEAVNQASEAISAEYAGIVFIFDEFGRYIEDNHRTIKIKAIQDIAEICDHGSGNNHIILVSHKEISQYTQNLKKSISNEWKKVEGRYKPTPINDKQDQCLSLVKNILIKREDYWKQFKEQYGDQLNLIYTNSLEFNGFLINNSEKIESFEAGFPIHPIALYVLDWLSKKVAQNERTFFTYLAGKEEHSLYSFLVKHDTSEFHFVGIDEMYNYFEPNIKSVQTSTVFDWYRNLQSALSKVKLSITSTHPMVKLLKAMAVIGIIDESSAISSNEEMFYNVIDEDREVLKEAIDELCELKVIKYVRSYERYEFFDASNFDIDEMISEDIYNINNDMVALTLNSDFANFIIKPFRYNRLYKINRVFIPVFITANELIKRKGIINQLPTYYDGVVIMVFACDDVDIELLKTSVKGIPRSIAIIKKDSNDIQYEIKKYISIVGLQNSKQRFINIDSYFENEIQFHLDEQLRILIKLIHDWYYLKTEDLSVLLDGEEQAVTSYDGLCELASKCMLSAYPQTLLVNNELVNKNALTPSITSAKKNVIKAMITSNEEGGYFNLQYLSPEYVLIRSVLVKNGYYEVENPGQYNQLSDGERPQESVLEVFERHITTYKNGAYDFYELYHELKQQPFGLRDGYLGILVTYFLKQYQKSLIISSHGIEQEFSVDLLEEMIKRPKDFKIFISDWSKEQQGYIDKLESMFLEFISGESLAKNRLKAIYEGMFLHFKNISKFARTTNDFVSDNTKMYREVISKTYYSFYDFAFKDLLGLTGDYDASIELIKSAKEDLEGAPHILVEDIRSNLCSILEGQQSETLVNILRDKYERYWKDKNTRVYDYYTNSFMELMKHLSEGSADFDVVTNISKCLTGFEVLYWSDKHRGELLERFRTVINKLNQQNSKDKLEEREVKLTLLSASGDENTVIFDTEELSTIEQTAKNKINAVFSAFGASYTYEQKTKVLFSLLEDLIEGK